MWKISPPSSRTWGPGAGSSDGQWWGDVMLWYANHLIHSRQSTIDTWNSVWSLSLLRDNRLCWQMWIVERIRIRYQSFQFIIFLSWFLMYLPVPVSPLPAGIWSRGAGWHRTWDRMAWCRGWWGDPLPSPASPCAPSPAWPALSRRQTFLTRRKSWVRDRETCLWFFLITKWPIFR